MARRTRPVALARHGMVASPHYLASVVGVNVLQEGGSAVDAAVAINAALGVVYPHMTGIGGDAFWLIYDAGSGGLHSLNGSGRAGSRATRDLFRSTGHETIPIRGPLSVVTVPGAVDSWCTAHDRFGRLPLRRLLTPAIAYAREGYPVCDGMARCFEGVAALGRYRHSREAFLPGGRPPRPGDVVRLPNLAATMEALADGGRDGFCRGPVAEQMASALQQGGGLLTTDDLASVRSDWVDPISTTYRGLACYQHPPNSQGFVHLMALNILEGYDLSPGMADGADYLHVAVEGTKLAMADRDRYLTDPDFAEIPLTHLLSKEYATTLRDRIDPNRAGPAVPQPQLAGDTTCTVVIDGDGNAVSVIQSLYHECGSAFVAGDTGVLLQNRGAFFSLEDNHVNRLEPGKRTSHTLMPGVILRDGRPFMVYGAMGGEGQPQTLTALVANVVNFGRDVQSAIDSPRWLYGRTWGAATTGLRLEARYDDEAISMLRAKGHEIRVVEEWDDVLGHAQAIIADPDSGVLMGGSDPRGDGIALGW